MQEVYISVDIEAAGPAPGNWSMLAIGACVVGNTSLRFYRELKPISNNFLPAALKKCSFSDVVSRRSCELGGDGGAIIKALSELGVDPRKAMHDFESWLGVGTSRTRPVFVGFNAPFDWMFVCDYFWRFLGRNPFGHNALDIKSYFMGMTGCTWYETGKRSIPPQFHSGRRHTHNAEDDAVEQAEIFEKMLRASCKR